MKSIRTSYSTIVLLTIVNCVFPLLSFASAVIADDSPEWKKKTYVYKAVGEIKIEADVYRPNDQIIRPLVVWIHGGALISGHRDSIPGNIRELCQKDGFALVSIDYRLAPEVKLPAIIDDLRDAFHWIRASARDDLFINPDKIVVVGGSAGGYLTLMTGVVVNPRPTALVAYYGYGDVDGDWYKKHSQHYRTTVRLIPEAEARAGVGQKVITGTDNKNPDHKGRGNYYLFLRQNGLWTEEVTGFDPATQKNELDPYCPVRNISSSYPPTLLIHGTADTDVPYELSVDMDRVLTVNNIQHELITVLNGNHGLGRRNTTANPADIDNAHERAMEFIRKSLTK